MKIPIFELERVQSIYENTVEYNLTESGFHPLTLSELLSGEQIEELTSTVLGYGQTNGSVALRERIVALYDGQTIDNVLVTNGYINEKALASLLPFIDAANIDIKFFRQDLYKKYCGGNLGDVMRTIEMFVKAGRHIELTLCVIPGLNDNENEFREMIDWIWALSPAIPLHISRYFPAYKHKAQPTSLKMLNKLRDIAIKKLDFVYQGNVSGQTGTYCPSCKTLLISRAGYHTEIKALKGDSCAACGAVLPIVL